MLNTVLGFDFGLRRLGVAVGQCITSNAAPLCTLTVAKGLPDWSEIEKIFDEWNPDALIVGIPINVDDSEQFITHAAKNFVKQLRHRYTIAVFTTDERYTTIAAREEIFTQGGYRKLKNAEVDSVAAKLILESWMREHDPTPD